jgi:hypothetical protein
MPADAKNLTSVQFKKKLHSVLFTYPEVNSVQTCLTEELTFHQGLFPMVLGLMICKKAREKGDLYIQYEQTFQLPSNVNKSEIHGAATCIHSPHM